MRPTVEQGFVDTYAAPNETIVNAFIPGGVGCLVSFQNVDGALLIEVYRADTGVQVRLPGERARDL